MMAGIEDILFLDSGSILVSIANFILVVAIAFFLHYAFDFLIRFLLKKTKSNLDDKVAMVIRAPVFWSLLLLGLYLVFSPLIISSDTKTIYRNLLASSLVIVWSFTAARIIRIIIRQMAEGRDSEDASESINTVIPLINNFVLIAALAVIILAILLIWGIGITPVLASAGLIGAGLAFAARDTIANFIGGISVFLDKTYKVGDYVILADNSYRGEVIEIGARSTKIRTRDNVLLSVPNSVMVTNAVVNETGFDPKLRIRIPLMISYKSDLEKVESILLKIAVDNPHIVDEPKSIVRYRSFGDSGLSLEFLCTIEKPIFKGLVTHQLIKQIHKIFAQNNISIPYPHREVYLHKDQK